MSEITIKPPLFILKHHGGKVSMSVSGGAYLCVWSTWELAEEACEQLEYGSAEIEEVGADRLMDLVQQGLRLPTFRGLAVFGDDGAVVCVETLQSLRDAIAALN